jgi:hypothetical protein
MMILISEMLTLTLIMQQIWIQNSHDVPSYYVPTHASAGRARPKRASIERSTPVQSSILRHVLIAGGEEMKDS